MGPWIEIESGYSGKPFEIVGPYMGPWIEIRLD